MKKSTKYFIYFVLIAPILAKVIEWFFQIIPSNGLEFIKSIWYFQLIFIIGISISTFLVLFKFIKIKHTPENLGYIVGISYLLKEVYNWTLVYSLNEHLVIGLVALIIEPIFIYTLIGLWLPKLIFKK